AGLLHRIAVRASLDLIEYRRTTRPLDVTHLELTDTRSDHAQLAADREVRGLIDAGLNRLPDRLRVPFVLCELEGWTNAEAAAVLGCPVGTVESRLTRARHRLRGWLTVRGVTPAIALPAGVRLAMVRAAAPGAAVAPAVRALADRAVPMALAAKLR